MSAKKRLGLQGKMLLAVLGSLTVILGGLVGFVALRSRESAMVEQKALIAATTEAQANQVRIQLEIPLATARDLAGAFAGVLSAGPMDRAVADNLLRASLEDNPDFLAVWACFEPDALDGRDDQYANTRGHDATGRFVPYWNRATGAIAVEPLKDYDRPGAGDYYLNPKRTGKETLAEPYTYDAGGKKVLMTSLVVPVMVGGRFVGAIGVDLDLAFLQKKVGSTRILDRGYVNLFSNGATYVAAPKEELVGKNLAEVGKGTIRNLEETIANFRQGKRWDSMENSVAWGEMAYKIRIPIPVGRTGTPWSLSAVVPESDITAAATALVRTILLVSLGALLLLGGIVWVSVRRLVRPVTGVKDVLDSFAEMDFASHEDRGWLRDLKDKDDEVGDMVRAILQLQGSLAEVVHSLSGEVRALSESAQNLAAIAEESVASMEEVKASVDRVNSLSAENASALEETNAGVEEVSAGAGQNARASAQGAEAASRTAEAANRVADSVEGVIRTMGEVRAGSAEGVESMRAMAGSVEQVTGFVSTIRSIADQTNLLALNAAIEAARAGEAGRGFAVVAEEVRKLAEESATAAQRIEELIRGLGSDARKTLETTVEAERALDSMTEIVRRTQEELRGAVSEVAGVNEAVQSIAAASEEQAASAQEMAKNVDRVTQGTQEVVRTLETIGQATEDTARASQSVAQESQGLTDRVSALSDLMGRFRTNANRSDRPALAAGGR